MKNPTLLQRILGDKSDAAASVEAAVAEATSALQAEYSEFKATAEEVLAATESQLSEATAALAEAATRITELEASLAVVAAEKQAAAESAEVARLALRQEKIVAAVGEGERADALRAATEGMEDAAFDAVLAAVGATFVAESKSALFTEVGVAAEADASKAMQSNGTRRILEEKYGPKANS